MPIYWPTNDLPDYLLIDGASGTIGDGTIRSNMDVGPAKLRRRSTAMPETFQGSQYLNSTQLASLITFYKATTSHGSLSFEWKHPVTRSTCNMTFVGPPQYTPMGGLYWQVYYQFEILP